MLDLTAVIPALNAADRIGATLAAMGPAAAIIVVDGGSRDATASIAEAAGARVLRSPPGRGGQIAAGVAAAETGWLLILHADSVLSTGWQESAEAHMRTSRHIAGYFRFALDSGKPQARRLERMVYWRSRVLALPYGDQGLLIHRALLASIGGVRPVPIMEDVDLVRRLGRGRLVGLRASAVTSAERWERDGWYRRSARNLLCLSLWFLGVPPATIRRLYG